MMIRLIIIIILIVTIMMIILIIMIHKIIVGCGERCGGGAARPPELQAIYTMYDI